MAWMVPAGTKMTSSLRTWLPLNQVRDRAILDRGAQLRRRELPLQPDGNLSLGRCRQDVPGLGLAVRQPDRMREGIVRVDLDGQRLSGEQQLEQQGRGRRVRVGTLKPEFANRGAVRLDLAPGQEIGTSPGFAHDPHAGMFDRHDVLLVRVGGIARQHRFGAHADLCRAVNAAGSRSGAWAPRWFLCSIFAANNRTWLRRGRFLGRNVACWKARPPRGAPIEAGCLFKIAHQAIADAHLPTIVLRCFQMS